MGPTNKILKLNLPQGLSKKKNCVIKILALYESRLRLKSAPSTKEYKGEN